MMCHPVGLLLWLSHPYTFACAIKAENQIKKALREKEVLLKEIHHRVKNNVQIISSLLYFESRYLTDEKTLNILENCQNRIQSMALIHERLYESRDTATVEKINGRLDQIPWSR